MSTTCDEEHRVKYAKIIQALTHHGHHVEFFETIESAAKYITGDIQRVKHEHFADDTSNKHVTSDRHTLTVGFGDSKTLAALKLDERLSSLGDITVINPGRTRTLQDFLETARRTLTTDVFLTSINAVAETGEMVNIDGTGNRVASSLFGHKKVYFVFGTNKIAPTLDDAIYRARNIAAPQNARRHKYKTPCAVTRASAGSENSVTFREPSECRKCYDCSSPDRICNSLVIYLRAERFVESEVVIIDENLGL